MNDIPRTIGHYVVWEEIARRGYVTLYRGYDPDLKQEVAVRLFHYHLAQHPTLWEKVRHYLEQLQASTPTHPGIVPILAWGFTETDKVYMVSRMVRGTKLAEVLKRKSGEKRYDAHDTLHLLNALAEILEVAHRHGVVHGALKPNNIFLVPGQDGKIAVQICDFGMMNLLNLITRTTEPTAFGFGDAPYMSPQQVWAEPDSPACDRYAMGVIAFYALTGNHPYDIRNTPDIYFHHQYDPLPDILTYRSDLPPRLKEYFQKALAKKAVERFPSAQAMAKEFQQIVAPKNTVASPTWWELVAYVTLATTLLCILGWWVANGS